MRKRLQIKLKILVAFGNWCAGAPTKHRKSHRLYYDSGKAVLPDGRFQSFRGKGDQLDGDWFCCAAECLRAGVCAGQCGSADRLLAASRLSVACMRVAVAFHTDWIRLPMIGIALAGALLNLWVLSRLRRLRSNPASAWRRGRRPKATAAERRFSWLWRWRRSRWWCWRRASSAHHGHI